ncbi:MAG: DNA-protecting protein DprA [Chloroflexi bacterium]|nr:DNA-protecting protein DprA [Chloroflexota bacterium]
MIDSAWVALSLIERLGGKTLHTLMRHFNHDPRAVLAAAEDDLRQVRGIGPRLAQQIHAVNLDAVERAIPVWQNAGVQIVTWLDAAYPPRLRALDDAPPTLFVRGRWQARWARCAAIIGTRAPQPESRLRAQNLASALAERGYLIVSGLALGIDTAAHLGALAVPEGLTLAVLGCGVLNVYPSANRALAQAIVQRGALLSETHPQASPNAGALVARNRIITGLSDLVIVVETETDGGAMHAARFALAQGRAVYAVDIAASGNRALIEAGAGVLPAEMRKMPF